MSRKVPEYLAIALMATVALVFVLPRLFSTKEPDRAKPEPYSIPPSKQGGQPVTVEPGFVDRLKWWWTRPMPSGLVDILREPGYLWYLITGK